MQPKLTKYFRWVKRTLFLPRVGRELPTVIRTLVLSFVKATIDDEVKSGVQRTMTEFLDDGPNQGEFCYEVNVYMPRRSSASYGPFRFKKEALQRARDIIQTNELVEVQVLSYDSRYLGNRSGNWCDLEEVFTHCLSS